MEISEKFFFEGKTSSHILTHFLNFGAVFISSFLQNFWPIDPLFGTIADDAT
jgi:hypothetical protein